MDNSELATRISTYLNAQSDIVSKKEFMKAVGKIYADLEKGKPAKKGKDGVEKKKREPTKYNLFMRAEMAVLKARVQNAETELNNREMMSRVAKKWQETKAAAIVDEKPAEVVAAKKEKKADAKKEEKKPVAKKEEKPAAKKESSDEEDSEKDESDEE